MNMPRKIKLLLILGLVFALMLTGCAKTETGEEKVIHTCKNYEYWEMDPAIYSYYQTFALSEDIYEGLVAFDSELNPTPKLATEWEVSDDYLEYDFTLREGVQFHKDYGEMTASDVVFTFQRMKDMGAESTAGVELGIENITVEELDKYTVKFTLEKADPAFLLRLCQWCGFIVSEAAVEDLGEDFVRNPVGTGPFEFVESVWEDYEEGARFEDYWGEPASIDRVICYYITDTTTMFNAFESGELDLIYSQDDMKNLEYTERDDVKIVTFPSPQVRVLSINPNEAPLNDIRVRQAIFHAIDVDDFIENFTGGMQSTTTSIVPEACKYALFDNFKADFNIEKSKELLKEAGYPDGFKVVMGVPNDQSADVAVVVQGYLAKVGIEVDVQALEFASWMDQAKAGKWPIWYLGRTSNVLPDTFFKFFMTDYVGASNFSAFSDAKFDKLAKAAFSENDETKRTEHYHDAQRYLNDQYVVYPFYTLNKAVLCKDDIAGDIFDPVSTIRFSLVDKK